MQSYGQSVWSDCHFDCTVAKLGQSRAPRSHPTPKISRGKKLDICNAAYIKRQLGQLCVRLWRVSLAQGVDLIVGNATVVQDAANDLLGGRCVVSFQAEGCRVVVAHVVKVVHIVSKVRQMPQDRVIVHLTGKKTSYKNINKKANRGTR